MVVAKAQNLYINIQMQNSFRWYGPNDPVKLTILVLNPETDIEVWSFNSKKGKTFAVTLSLSFQELESLYNDDYDSDNNTPVSEIEDDIFNTDFAGQAKSRGIGF